MDSDFLLGMQRIASAFKALSTPTLDLERAERIELSKCQDGSLMPYRLATPAKLVAERRVELLISRLSIECFQPTKLLRNGAEKRNRTADLLRTEQALFQLSYFDNNFGADGRTRTCDELGVGQPI